MLILLFFIFSNCQTIYISNKAFPSLQVRFKRKLLKKEGIIHTTQINRKTVPHQEDGGGARSKTENSFLFIYRKRRSQGLLQAPLDHALI